MDVRILGEAIKSKEIKAELGGSYTVFLLENKTSVDTYYRVVTVWNIAQDNLLVTYVDYIQDKSEALKRYEKEIIGCKYIA